MLPPRSATVSIAVAAAVLFATACGSGTPPTSAEDFQSAPTTDVPRPESTDAPPTTSGEAPLTSTGVSCPDPLPIGRSTLTVESEGGDHTVHIHVPTGASGQKTLPAVIAFHGLTYDGPRMDEYTQFEALSEAEGFIVVHPTGLTATEGATLLTFGSGWEIPPDFVTPERDDVSFVGDLVDELVEEWCVDENAVYAIGDSNGAFFVSSLVCERADLFAAVGSIAGLYHPDSCSPTHPVPYIAFHGTADDNIPYYAGGESQFAAVPDVAEKLFTGMEETFAEFAADAGCELQPTVVSVSDNATRHDYRGCERGVTMSFYSIDGLGPLWPGQACDDISGIDATQVAWRFFERARRPSGAGEE